MNENTMRVYSEVYQVLNVLGREYINRLPKSLYNMLEEKRDITYNPRYNLEKSLSKQNINKESLNILALIHYNYWCNDENEKIELRNILKSNEEIHEKNLEKKYNTENLFKNKKKHYTNVNSENNITNTAIIEYKENILKKIINKIKDIFNLNRKRS